MCVCACFLVTRCPFTITNESKRDHERKLHSCFKPDNSGGQRDLRCSLLLMCFLEHLDKDLHSQKNQESEVNQGRMNKASPRGWKMGEIKQGNHPSQPPESQALSTVYNFRHSADGSG